MPNIREEDREHSSNSSLVTETIPLETSSDSSNDSSEHNSQGKPKTSHSKGKMINQQPYDK